MKVLRFVLVLLSITTLLIMQACGSGGGTSDTAGSLTLSTPTVTDNGDGSSSVSATATYTPPAGKSAQGVVITITASDNFGNAQSLNGTLTSGSNAVIATFIIPQQLNISTQVSIVASIGGMTSGVFAIVPKFTPGALSVPITTVNFTANDLSNDPAFDKFINIIGGTPPYTITSSATADINAILFNSFTPNGGTIRIRLQSVNINSVPTTATVTVADSVGGSVPITVNYFK